MSDNIIHLNEAALKNNYLLAAGRIATQRAAKNDQFWAN